MSKAVRAVEAAVLFLFSLVPLALTQCSSQSNARPPASAEAGDSRARAEVEDRLGDATTLIEGFRDKLPESVTARARCVAVVPSMMKGGFIVGARHGEGFAMCRTASTGSTGGGNWSAPAPISVSGGSAGAQIGFESVDLVMLVESDDGMKKLLRSKFELGADVSASAGPVGRGREADTDATMKAEVLSYTRSRGLFAGAELSGAVVKQDEEATRALYGAQSADFRALLAGEVPVAAGASQRFVDAVRETMH